MKKVTVTGLTTSPQNPREQERYPQDIAAGHPSAAGQADVHTQRSEDSLTCFFIDWQI